MAIKPASPLTPGFEEFVNKKLADWHVPSCTIAVIQGDEVHAAGYGIAQYPATPAKPSTLYYTGSTTKAFLGAAWAMFIDSEENQTREAGKIAFDTPLATLIRDDFVLSDEYATTRVTIEDALSHRSGFPGHDLCYGGPMNTVQKVVRNMRNLPMANPLRTTHEYCNIMYMACCHALQTVTGKWLGKILHEKIWEPLGMKNTFFDLKDAQECVQKGEVDLAVGYRWVEGKDGEKGKFVPEKYMIMPETDGAGGIISNVLDYAKWTQMLIGKKAPLSEKAHSEIVYPRSIDTGSLEPYDGAITYALGWAVQVYKGQKMIWHNGGLVAFGAHLVYFPDKKWGVVMMANTRQTSNWMLTVLTMRLVDDMLEVPEEKRFDFEAKYQKSQKDFLDMAKDAKKKLYPNAPEKPIPTSVPLDGYSGTYTNPGYQSVTFETKDHIDHTTDTKTTILSGDLHERTWTTSGTVMRMEHVSGEFWIAYIPVGENELPQKVEFRLGEDGKAKEVGISLDMNMADRKVWFQRTS